MVLMLTYTITYAQNQWFEIYTDTLSLNKASEKLTQDFEKQVSKIDSKITLNNPKSVFNAIGPFYNPENNTINLPIWNLSPEMFQDFCITVMGNKNEGKELFGLFFNGFYVPHELGHALQFAADRRFDNEYDNEYNANIIAILYWKNRDKSAQLDKCYQYAIKALEKIPNPIPEGENEKLYFTNHYQDFGADPAKYAYIQFTQYIKAFKETENMNFTTYLESFLNPK